MNDQNWYGNHLAASGLQQSNQSYGLHSQKTAKEIRAFVVSEVKQRLRRVEQLITEAESLPAQREELLVLLGELSANE